jgi:hypothetical protein
MFFRFEADFVESLRCIPMVVRYKLDVCGVKLKLTHWRRLSEAQRQELVSAPSETETEREDYRRRLRDWIWELTGEYPKDLTVSADWLDETQVPTQILEEFPRQGLAGTLSLERWRSLKPLERFVLLKLSQPGHENRNFPAALAEFGLNGD